MFTNFPNSRFPHPSRYGVAALLGLGLSLSSTAFANGQPFQEIDESITALNQQLESLGDVVDQQLANTLPVEMTVDCAAGQSISAVVDQYRYATAPLTIDITGVCDEVVVVRRNDVTLRAASPGAGIHSDSPSHGNVTASQGSGVTVEGLSLTGGGSGFMAARNSQSVLSNVDISQADSGVVALDGSFIEVIDSTIHNNENGAVAMRGGVVAISSSLIEFNTNGVVATFSGVVNLRDIAPDATSTDGVTLRNNTIGVVAQMGGTAAINGALIEAGNIGVFAQTQAAVQLSSTVLRDHATAGVFARRNTSLSFEPNNDISNNLFGIFCSPDTAYLLTGGSPGSVINNINVDINGCTGP